MFRAPYSLIRRSRSLPLCSAAFAAAFLLLGPLAPAQENAGSRVAVPLSDPSRPARVKAEVNGGSIAVSGYDGNQVIVEARAAQRESSPDGESKKVEISTPGLSISEENNVVRIRVAPSRGPLELSVRAPFASSLKLTCQGGGEISADQISGEIEVEALHGNVVLRKISGPILAQNLNGKITATIVKVSPDKPMSLVALNGDIEVNLPADAQANLRLETQNGSIRSDFEIQPADDDKRRRAGRHGPNSLKGPINGGGPEIRLKTLNGNIRLLKDKP